MFLHGTSKINDQGHLTIGGLDTVELAQQFGTPLYVMDEQLVRDRCRGFIDAFRSTGLHFQVAYASKALCVQAICQIVEQEGLSLDVVSEGELYTAIQAGFPVDRIHFHGNNKTVAEIEMALDAGIGCFVVDNFIELDLLNDLAGRRGVVANMLFRITPGVEAHTHEFITTGQTDSKFGFDLGNGSALEAVGYALTLPNVKLLGTHSHIGSQIFETDGFTLAVEKHVAFAGEVRRQFKHVFPVLNLGGGFGIRYTAEDDPLPVGEYVLALANTVKAEFDKINYPYPEIWIEPGRSIVGDAGTTLYTIGTHKDIPGVRKYISVDGGMSDNPRPALYDAVYDAIIANRANDEGEEVVTVAGKACESGDKLIHDIKLPVSHAGDILAVFCTGAYNYSMASNYNRIRRPAMVLVQDGQADVIVERESLEQIVTNDRVPARFAKAIR